MYITQKTQFFPTKYQQDMLSNMFGFRRLIFNAALELLLNKYGDLKEHRKDIKKKELLEYRDIIFRKEDKYKDILKKIPNQVLDTALEDLLIALESLWKKGKEIKYRSKKTECTARLYKKNEYSFVPTTHNALKIVKLGLLELAEKIRFDGDIKIVTFTYNAGKYFISTVIDIEEPELMKPKNKHIGFDWGLKTTLTGYNGKHITEFNFDKAKLKKLDARIARYQKLCSRVYGTRKNADIARAKLQDAYNRRTNYQEDAIKKLAHYLVYNYDYVVFEDLNMSFVFKNKNLARKAGEQIYYKIKSIITRKFNQYGKKVYMVDKSFPSTQKCSMCGKVKTKQDKLKLSNRFYTCSCGCKLDRDHNAAINIYNEVEKTEFVLS
jgi:putative transposase